MPVAQPHQELRFTRARQAVGFWLAAAVAAAAALTLCSVAIYRHIDPNLPHAAWALPPLALAVGFARLALRCTKRAYLILTPLGVEIFPFFRPADGMRLVSWQEIAAVETDPAHRRLTLHFNREKTAGVHLSLRPLPANRRELLLTALQGRIGQ
jgi:hypothetical protein